MSEIEHIRDFVRTFVPRRVTIPGEGDFYVRPASVREALTLYALIDQYTDRGAVEVIRDTLKTWFPEDLFDLVMENESLSWRRRIELILWLLKTGTTLQGKETEGDPKTDELFVWVRARDWFQLMGEYRNVYGSSQADVLSEPFPLFLNLTNVMDRVRAVSQVFNIGWWAGAQTGKVDPIIRNAGFEKRLIFEEPAHQDDAWFEEQIEKAKRLSKELWGQS